MGEIVYHPRVKLYRDQRRRVTQAYVDVEGVEKPITVGIHGSLKEYYGVQPQEEHPSTYDYLLAAHASCACGVLEGVLEAHEIPVKSLTGEVEGDVEKDAGPEWPLGHPQATRLTLLTRMRVLWHLVVPPGKREVTDKAARLAYRGMAVFQSFEHGIEVEPSWQIEEVD